MKVGIVRAQFNQQYTQKLEEGVRDFLASKNISDIYSMEVPGAFELGLGAKSLLQDAGCDYVVCLGVVIKGETDHYDFVCKAAQEGCLQVSLELSKPVAFGVLTVNNYEQMYDRIWGKKGNYGYHAAQAGYEMLGSMKQAKEENIKNKTKNKLNDNLL